MADQAQSQGPGKVALTAVLAATTAVPDSATGKVDS